MEKTIFNVVSFSGGKDSTAMLLKMIEEKIDIDCVLFCDTGLEFPQMYEHIDKVERETGIHITREKQRIPLREKIKDIEKQLRLETFCEDLTVCELVEKYIATKTGVTHSMKTGYKYVQNILAKEAFWQRKIASVKTSDAKIFLINMQKNGRGYSTIHTVRGVLRPAFQMAADDDMIIKNPFQFEHHTVVVNDSVKRDALTREQERKFLQFIKEDSHYGKYYDAFFILFKTELRISEFCGLTIKDVDFKNNVLKVNHQLQRTSDMKYVCGPTKTGNGVRDIPMKLEVVAAFKRCRCRKSHRMFVGIPVVQILQNQA